MIEFFLPELMGQMEMTDPERIVDAIDRLNEARRNGIHEVVWDIFGSDTNDFPIYRGSRFAKFFGGGKEYKNSSETAPDYICRCICEGRSDEYGEKLFLVNRSIALEFSFERGEYAQNARRKVFFDPEMDSDLGVFDEGVEKVEGMVVVNSQHYRLTYRGWHDTKSIDLSAGIPREKPDRIVDHA